MRPRAGGVVVGTVVEAEVAVDGINRFTPGARTGPSASLWLMNADFKVCVWVYDKEILCDKNANLVRLSMHLRRPGNFGFHVVVHDTATHDVMTSHYFQLLHLIRAGARAALAPGEGANGQE